MKKVIVVPKVSDLKALNVIKKDVCMSSCGPGFNCQSSLDSPKK